MSKVDVSVVVNHYKSPQVLRMALGYVRKWKEDFEAKGGTAEVIVTDSETIPETKELMDMEFSDFIFLKEPKNIGFGRSVNRAWKIVQGTYVFTMNADFVIPRPEELNKLLSFVQQNPEVGIAGPRLLNFDNTHQSSAFRFYTPLTILYRRTPLGKLPVGKKAIEKFELKHAPELRERPTEVDWLMGSALLTRKKIIDEIGTFDERYFMYMEDVDLCRRIWEAGYKVMYYPYAHMYHFHGKASRTRNILKAMFNKYTRIHLSSAYKYFKKFGLDTPTYGV
ncbi:MAG: glycosyltransferase family 2 protein [Candidatus Spechtbacterales bacterium]|nr:glycosyltransferase family 2 protein [Candidatus Spechtbacterales bacterium]